MPIRILPAFVILPPGAGSVPISTELAEASFRLGVVRPASGGGNAGERIRSTVLAARSRLIYIRATAYRLLIVSTDFFIQRCTGEVAEWSKALPC